MYNTFKGLMDGNFASKWGSGFMAAVYVFIVIWLVFGQQS